MARDAHRLIGARLEACEQSIDQALSSIAELNPEVNAFAHVDAAGAREAIARLGWSGSSENLALQCVPFGVKDLIDVAGMPTRAYSEVVDGGIALRDAQVIERLRQAGAIPVGKTHTQEFAYGVVTPQVANPAAPGYIAGGSSGGSAAAVAAGMVPLAIGTDTAGSVRIPAALCGVVGLKPRSHIVPLDGIIPLAPSMDSCGPIAATVEEVTVALRVMAGSPFELDQEPDVRSIGLLGRSVLGPMHEEVERMLGDAIQLLTHGVGLEPRDVHIRPLEEWAAPRSIVQMTEALAVHEDAGWWPSRRSRYGQEVIENLERAAGFSSLEHHRALTKLNELKAEFLSVFETVDVLVLPTTPIPAPTLAEADKREAGSFRRPVVTALTRFCAPANATDVAAISLPASTTSDGRPLGIQIVGRTEAHVIEAARLWESAA